jgi:exodeoxyribonuclease X
VSDTDGTRAAWTTFRYAAVDVEGNGQQPPDLVEISVVPIANGEVGTPATWLVRPHRPITSMATRFHKITDKDVAACPPVADVASEILDVLGDAVFVAHNANVDLGVVTRELPGFNAPTVVDTLKLARRLAPGLGSYRLGLLVDAFDLGRDLPAGLQPHRATYDAVVCARLLVHLANTAAEPQLMLADLLGSPTGLRAGADDDATTLF